MSDLDDELYFAEAERNRLLGEEPTVNLPDYNLDPPDDPEPDDDYEPDYEPDDFDDPTESDYAADRYERGFYDYG